MRLTRSRTSLVRGGPDGGDTAVTNCCLLCTFHHPVVVHRWRWTLILNPDGTTTATSPDGRRVLHSHAPPAAADRHRRPI
jgi:hypothetical protein